MLQTSARLLRLLSLFQAQRYWSGAELAERIEVTPRTLRRDIDRLRSLGYPVHSTSGAAGGYQLGAGAHLPPLLLDDDEAVAVAVGLRSAAQGTVTGLEEASLRAMAKLRTSAAIETSKACARPELCYRFHEGRWTARRFSRPLTSRDGVP